MSEKENKTGIIVLAVLGVLAAAGGVYSIVSAVTSGNNSSVVYNAKTLKNSAQQSKPKKITGNYIAVLSIEGVIEDKNETYDQIWLLDTIEKLRFDSKNLALLLDINSPGGGIFEADEIYLALEDYKNEGKPVWAYMEQTAASGGYYISCAADVIHANRNTLTGSIGVLMGPMVNVSELLQKYGIKTTTFTSGKNKNMLSFDNPVTPEQSAIMQSIIDEAYLQFVEIVAKSRNLPLKAAEKLADGRLYTAKQALENGLIDEISRFEHTVAALQSLVSSENSTCSIEYLEPKQRQSIYDMLKDMNYLFESRSDEVIPLSLLKKFLNQSTVPQYRLQ